MHLPKRDIGASFLNRQGNQLRTNGKRGAMKRKTTTDLFEPDETSSAKATSRKRRKPFPELALPPSLGSTEGAETEPEDSPSQKPKVKATYSSLRSRSLTSPFLRQGLSKLSIPARNLPVIFDDIAPTNSRFASPSKLSKRMQGRPRTESSVENPSSKSPIQRTPFLPNLLPSPSKDAASSIPPLPPLLPQGTKISITRTYAGKFRSFLTPSTATSASNGPLSTAFADDEIDTRESYSSLRSRWGVDNSEDDPRPYVLLSPPKSNKRSLAIPHVSPSQQGKGRAAYRPVRPPALPGGIMNPLKSISELRNKGESRQFLDEVGYLFEGMDRKCGMGVRRASAFEITTRLCDPDFTRKVKAADFFTRTWEVFLYAGAGQEEDKILDVLLAFFASLVARDATSLSQLAQRPPTPPPTPRHKSNSGVTEDTTFTGILFRILDGCSADTDPLVLTAPSSTAGDAEFKKAGVNKKDRLTLTAIYRTISVEANLFSPEVPISISLLVSYTLQSLPPSMIPSKYFPSFFDSLRLSLSTPSTSLASSLSIKWNDAAEAVPFENVYYHLLLLDAYLLDQWGLPPSDKGSQSQTPYVKGANDDKMDRARDSWLAEDLVALGICVEINGMTDGSESSAPQRCLDIALRVLVNLTHVDKAWGHKVVQCEYAMGWLMRLIHRLGAGQELHSNNRVKAEEGMKLEGTKVRPSDDEDGAAISRGLDTLCLVLELLTNLVQIAEEAKHVVRDTRLSPSCGLKKWACARKCICSRQSSGIEILAQLYSQQQRKTESLSVVLAEDSPEARAEADASFLTSHLAVLFSLLMVGSPENQTAILSALPSPLPSTTSQNSGSHKASKRTELNRLIEQAKEFAVIYALVSPKHGGEKVAKEIVTFLETQRDSIS